MDDYGKMEIKDQQKSAHLSTGIFWHGAVALLIWKLVAAPCRQVASSTSTVLYSKVWALQNKGQLGGYEGSKLGEFSGPHQPYTTK